MSDLVGNHIVGFAARRLISKNMKHVSFKCDDNVLLKGCQETVQQPASK